MTQTRLLQSISLRERLDIRARGHLFLVSFDLRLRLAAAAEEALKVRERLRFVLALKGGGHGGCGLYTITHLEKRLIRSRLLPLK